MSESAILELNSSFKGREFYTEDFSKNYSGAMARKQAKTPPPPDWVIRFRTALADRGWKITELARRMGHDADENFLDKLYKYYRGEVKQPRGDMLGEIATALDMRVSVLQYGDSGIDALSVDNVHRLSSAAVVPTLGEVAAGVFREVLHADQGEFDVAAGMPNPPDPRYPVSAQYDLIVRGTSINRFAPDGYRLRVIDTQKTGRTGQEGEYVIVKRSRDGGQTVETTAKLYVARGDAVELWPNSDDPRWQTPLMYGNGKDDSETLEIVGVVLFAYQTSRSRR